jgi:hypothetical protein
MTASNSFAGALELTATLSIRCSCLGQSVVGEVVSCPCLPRSAASQRGHTWPGHLGPLCLNRHRRVGRGKPLLLSRNPSFLARP